MFIYFTFTAQLGADGSLATHRRLSTGLFERDVMHACMVFRYMMVA